MEMRSKVMDDFTKRFLSKYGWRIVFPTIYFYWLYNEITNNGEITFSDGFSSFSNTSFFYINVIFWGLSVVITIFIFKRLKEKEGGE